MAYGPDFGERRTPGGCQSQRYHRSSKSESNATGGFNIATAEISQDPLTGEWTDTNGPS